LLQYSKAKNKYILNWMNQAQQANSDIPLVYKDGSTLRDKAEEEFFVRSPEASEFEKIIKERDEKNKTNDYVDFGLVSHTFFPKFNLDQQTNTDTTMSRLQAKHPDVEAIVKDLDFQKWVMESVPRQDMWQKASAGDFNYADELFSQYKSLHGIKMEQQKEIARTEKERELNAATAVASGASQDAVSKGKPTYKRSELIRLQLEDPRRYADLQPEIYQAYKEGRVR